MHPSELFDELKRQKQLASDSDVARFLSLTPGRVSQMRQRKAALTPRQVAMYLAKAHQRGTSEALAEPIWPIVEMYEVDAVSSKQDKNWELLPTSSGFARNREIRRHLETETGIYVFFDSLGCPIYVGKTERQNLWKEMTNAFNRERSNHQTFVVPHPSTGSGFSPAWETPRQPVKRTAYLYNTATFFSAYGAAQKLTPRLEAMMVRIFCNVLSNKKMEKF